MAFKIPETFKRAFGVVKDIGNFVVDEAVETFEKLDETVVFKKTEAFFK